MHAAFEDSGPCHLPRHRRQRDDLMPRIIACGRRLLADRRGTALIGYSSLMLLVAIAAIAMLTQFRGGADLAPDSRIDLSH
jgi:hypothetical protein